MKASTAFALKTLMAILLLGAVAAMAAGRVEYKPRDYGFEAKYAEIGGINICYVDEGTGDETLILVHGLSGSLYNYLPAIARYSKSYRVIALDLPGHGNSERRNDIPYGISLFADTIKGLMEHLGIEKAVIAGTSMGGHTVAYFAWKYPEMTRGAILIDAAGMGNNFPTFAIGILKKHPDWAAGKLTKKTRKGAEKGGGASVESMKQKDGKSGARFPMFWDASKPSAQKWIADTNEYMSDFIWTDEFEKYNYALVKCAVSIVETPMHDKLSGIKVPTLIIWGDHDGLVDIENGFEYAEGIRGSFMSIIQDCGHNPAVEEPEQFYHSVDGFLSTLN